jgi:hypothetical protein
MAPRRRPDRGGTRRNPLQNDSVKKETDAGRHLRGNRHGKSLVPLGAAATASQRRH